MHFISASGFSWSWKIMLYNDHPDIVTDVMLPIAHLLAVVVRLYFGFESVCHDLVFLVVAFYVLFYKRLTPVETHMHAV